jgi:hypothetical protein
MGGMPSAPFAGHASAPGDKHAHSLPAAAGKQRPAQAGRLWACHPAKQRRKGNEWLFLAHTGR